jgi:hypothetical protein
MPSTDFTTSGASIALVHSGFEVVFAPKSIFPPTLVPCSLGNIPVVYKEKKNTNTLSACANKQQTVDKYQELRHSMIASRFATLKKRFDQKDTSTIRHLSSLRDLITMH